jgi:hypothetical protein
VVVKTVYLPLKGYFLLPGVGEIGKGNGSPKYF